MVEQYSSFELLAELSIGLAGFAGVAAALGGRSRAYGTVDLNRLKTLFVCAGSVLAGSLAVITLGALGLEDATVIVIVSAALALMVGAVGVVLMRVAVDIHRQAPETVPLYVVVIAITSFTAYEAILVLNVFAYRKPGLLLAALAMALIYGLWIFVRLMTRPS